MEWLHLLQTFFISTNRDRLDIHATSEHSYILYLQHNLSVICLQAVLTTSLRDPAGSYILPNAGSRGVAAPSSSLSTTVGSLGAPRQGSVTTGVLVGLKLKLIISSSSTALSLPLSLSLEELAFELDEGCHGMKPDDEEEEEEEENESILPDLSLRSRAATTAVNKARLCSTRACRGGSLPPLAKLDFNSLHTAFS